MPGITSSAARTPYSNSVQTIGTSARPPAAIAQEPAAPPPIVNVAQERVTQAHRPSAREAALRQQLEKIQQKSTPYDSKHGDKTVLLNGSVWVDLQPEESGKDLVVCRHSATEFVKEGGKKIGLMEKFSSEKGISNQFDEKLAATENAFHEIMRNAPPGCKSLVCGDQFGSFLQSLAQELESAHQGPNGTKEANCLVLTQDHVMALHVQRKNKNGVEYLAAKLYDPNATAQYRRVVKAAPKDFSTLTLEDMMVYPQLARVYAPAGDKPLSVVVSTNDRLQPKTKESVALTPDNMYLALRHEATVTVSALFKEAQETELTGPERFELFQANYQHEGSTLPGLAGALSAGYPASVKLFAQEVLTSPHFDAPTQAKLLAAKSSDGRPGLSIGLESGSTEAVKAFVQAVQGSKLDPETKAKLLAAEDQFGTPGLAHAFEKGHVEAIKVFVQEVLASDLEPEIKAKLLAAKDSDGGSALEKGSFNDRHEEAVDFFVQAVSDSTLDPKTKAQLLALAQ